MRSTISEKNIISDLFEWFNQFINRLTNYLLIIGSVIKKSRFVISCYNSKIIFYLFISCPITSQLSFQYYLHLFLIILRFSYHHVSILILHYLTLFSDIIQDNLSFRHDLLYSENVNMKGMHHPLGYCLKVHHVEKIHGMEELYMIDINK